MKRMPEKVLICCMDRDIALMEKQLSLVSGRVVLITHEGKMISRRQDDDGSFENIDVVKELIDRRNYCRLTVVKYDLYDFDSMMHALYVQISRYKAEGYEVMVSIIGGTGEYCAAACITGMMLDVDIVGRYHMDYRMPIVFEDGKMGSIDASQYGTSVIQRYAIPLPDLDLLRALKVYSGVKRGERTNTNVINAMIRDGIWFSLRGEDVPENGVDGTGLAEYNDKDTRKRAEFKDRNFYQRNVVRRWQQKEWVLENECRAGGYEMTDEGKRMLSIFMSDEEAEEEEHFNRKAMWERNGYSVSDINDEDPWKGSGSDTVNTFSPKDLIELKDRMRDRDR
mgnify:CR=1 FL=1